MVPPRGVALYDTLAVYIHVDDFGIFGTDSTLVDALANDLYDALVALGFIMKLSAAGAVARYIGFVQDRRRPVLALADDRLGTLDALITQVLADLWVHKAVLEHVVGLYTLFALAW